MPHWAGGRQSCRPFSFAEMVVLCYILNIVFVLCLRMHKKVVKHVHNFFVPHEGNDHLPHSVRHHSLLTYAGLLVAAKVFLLVAMVVSFPSVAEFSTITQNRITQLVNEARTDVGLGTVTVNPVLQLAAQYKLDNMFANNYFAHNAPDGTEPWEWFKQAGYLYTYAGENLAMNFVEAEEVHTAWMASPTHRANILSDNYNEIGVAVGVGNIEGEEVTLVVQMFGKTFVPPTVVQKDIPPVPPKEVKGDTEEVPSTDSAGSGQVKEPFEEVVPLAQITPPLAVLTDPDPATVAAPKEEVPEPTFKPIAEEVPLVPDSEVGTIPETAQVQEVSLSAPTQSNTMYEVIRFLRKFSVVIIAFVAFALAIKVFIKVRIQHKKTIALAIAIIILGLLLLAWNFHFLEPISGPVIIY